MPGPLPSRRLEPQHRQLLVAHGGGRRARLDERRVDHVDRRNRVDLAADLEQHRLRERGRQRQPQAERRAAPRRRAHLHLAAEPGHRLAHDVEPDAAPGELVGSRRGPRRRCRARRARPRRSRAVRARPTTGSSPTRRSRSAAVSTPRPSSEISSTSRLPSWRARIVIVAVGRLAACRTLGRWLDAMRDRVAEQLRDRIDELFGDRLVELGLLAERAQLDLEAGRPAQRAQRARGVKHQVARALHADAREAALELADRAAQRLDLVEQRRGGLRQQRGLAGELALGLAETRRFGESGRSRRAGSGACARGRARACAGAGRGARCACGRTAARRRSTSAHRSARARRAGTARPRRWAPTASPPSPYPPTAGRRSSIRLAVPVALGHDDRRHRQRVSGVARLERARARPLGRPGSPPAIRAI